MIGGMIFGRPSYGYGGGGFGGSGIGLIELLLLAGLGYFLYKRFIKNPSAGGRPASPLSGWDNVMGSPGPPPVPAAGYGNEMTSVDPVAETFRTIRQTEPDFDPERFKEIAQDVFFRIQAAWMRRDLTPVLGLIGDQLKTEYLTTMAELKQKGLINKLENIAVRKIEIVDAGVQGNEVYITLLFTANLLDYTVAESSGEIVSGSNTEPVKFEERWTFARPLNGTSWKLEGVAS
jgi:predicted lipid-binding transport protein (Tim44 family)